MSYLDETVNYDGVAFPENYIQYGEYDATSATFSDQGSFNSALTFEATGPVFVSATVTLNSHINISSDQSAGVYGQGQVIAIAPSSFIALVYVGVKVPFPQYLEFTNPIASAPVVDVNYSAYQYNPQPPALVYSNACFAAGTLIEMASGAAPIESIRAGDLVRTVSGELRRVEETMKWLVTCAGHLDPDAVLPIEIAADAFGAGLPRLALRLSANHAVFVDGALIPIKCLINGTSIRRMTVSAIAYHHIELAAHDVVFANGLPCETLLDTGLGMTDRTLRRSSAHIPNVNYLAWETFGYAPMRLAGPEVERARHAIAARLSSAAV